jgi:NDP-sugar pyrophosphorylase family protein
MLGQFFSETDEKYNIVILAGGLGTRMGSASDYIPKALTKIGSQRAIDLIFSKFLLVANHFVVGTGWHTDLLESYIRGRYPNLGITFSEESVPNLKNNATSLMYALDNVDSRYGTIVSFCDLLILSNPRIVGNSIYLANENTKGVVGTFRHSAIMRRDIVQKVTPLKKPLHVSSLKNGVIGFFVFNNTILLKEIVYSLARKQSLKDITTDVVSRYVAIEETKAVFVEALLEFGTETDLQKARKVWETY